MISLKTHFRKAFRRTEKDLAEWLACYSGSQMSLFGAMIILANNIRLKPHNQEDKEDGLYISLEMISGVGMKNALYFNGYTNNEQKSGPTGKND